MLDEVTKRDRFPGKKVWESGAPGIVLINKGLLLPVRKEPTNSKTYLHCIHAGIWGGKPGVRDVYVANLRAPVVLLAEDVGSQSCARSEIDLRPERGYFVVREQGPTIELKIGDKISSRGEVPLKVYGVNSKAICGVSGLEDEEHWHGIDGSLKSSLKKTRAVGTGKDPSIA